MVWASAPMIHMPSRSFSIFAIPEEDGLANVWIHARNYALCVTGWGGIHAGREGRGFCLILDDSMERRGPRHPVRLCGSANREHRGIRYCQGGDGIDDGSQPQSGRRHFERHPVSGRMGDEADEIKQSIDTTVNAICTRSLPIKRLHTPAVLQILTNGRICYRPPTCF